MYKKLKGGVVVGMKDSVSRRLKDMPFGGLYEIFGKASKLEKSGKKMIHMEIGRPDFLSPEPAMNAVTDALRNGMVHYTPVPGIIELKEAILEREARRHNLHYSEDEIVIMAGACEVLSSIFFSILDPGDELIVLGPYFSAYKEQAIIADFKLVEVPLSVDDEWQIDMQKLEKQVTAKTKAILVNNPNNPGGYVLDRANIKKIADFAKKHNLLVISDDCYDEFYYDEKPVNIATLPEMRERTIIAKSASKAYSMTGWRIGYVLGPKEILKYANKVHQNFSTCATAFAQWGAIKAYKECDDFIDNMVSTFKKRRDYLYSRLSEIKEFKLIKPKGAFYMFPKLINCSVDVDIVCDRLLDNGVVTVPGRYFGEGGDGYLRLAYCREMEELEFAGDVIEKVFKEI